MREVHVVSFLPRACQCPLLACKFSMQYYAVRFCQQTQCDHEKVPNGSTTVAICSKNDMTTKLNLLVLNEVLPTNQLINPTMLMDEELLLERTLIYLEYSNILQDQLWSSTTNDVCLTPYKPSHDECFYLCHSFTNKFLGTIGSCALTSVLGNNNVLSYLSSHKPIQGKLPPSEKLYNTLVHLHMLTPSLSLLDFECIHSGVCWQFEAIPGWSFNVLHRSMQMLLVAVKIGTVIIKQRI